MLRFVNHGAHGEQNATVQKVFAKGSVHIILVAERRISKGEEILFNYGKKYKLEWVEQYSKLALERKKKNKKYEQYVFSEPFGSKKIDTFYSHLETQDIVKGIKVNEDKGLEKLLEDDKNIIIVEDEDDKLID